MQEEHHDRAADCEQSKEPAAAEVEAAVRFSLNTLLSLTERIKELEPQRENQPAPEVPNNILAAEYKRPWWNLIIALGGLYVGYLVLGKGHEPEN